MKDTITKEQLKLVHIARKQLGLQDDTYREILNNLFGVQSSKNLTKLQGSKFINHLKRCGFATQKKRREHAANIIRLATPSQHRLISVLSRRYIWRSPNGFRLWLECQRKKGYIKSITLHDFIDAHWVIEKLKQMTGTTTGHISLREVPHETV